MTRKIFRESITYNLNENPKINTIGDITNIKGHTTMILEIESFVLEKGDFLKLMVSYIVQDISKPVRTEEIIAQPSGVYEHPVFTSIYDRDDISINDLVVGNTYNHKGCVYKVLEYTNLELLDKELSIGFTVKPISPVLPQKLKQKRLEYKKEQVNFRVLDNTSKGQRV